MENKMIQLTEEMRQYINNARDNGNLCVLASASQEGTPNAGYIGTVVVLDEGSLAFRQRLPIQENIQENPKVVLLFYDHRAQVGWKFRCTAAPIPGWSGALRHRSNRVWEWPCLWARVQLQRF